MENLPENKEIALPFSPKDDFQKFHQDAFKELREQVNSKWLRVSLDSALTQLSAHGAENLELRGARRLIETLFDLSEKDTKTGKLPAIRLETYEPN